MTGWYCHDDRAGSSRCRARHHLHAGAGVEPADAGRSGGLLRHLGVRVFAAVAIPILLLALAAIRGNMIQPRPVWSVDAPMPKLNRISPMAGTNYKAVPR